jgi:hypothetical protein
MSRSEKNVAPVQVYLDIEEIPKIKTYAKKNKLKMSRLAREAFAMRMSDSDTPYNQGFNHGLNDAIKIAKTHDAGKMMFPSGASWGQVLAEEIEKCFRKVETS